MIGIYHDLRYNPPDDPAQPTRHLLIEHHSLAFSYWATG